MRVLSVFLLLTILSLSALAAPLSDVAAIQLSSDQMEAGTTNVSRPTAASSMTGEAATAGRLAANERYVLVKGTTCANRALIMASFSRDTAPADCQARCQADSLCSGFAIGSNFESRDCTLFKGKCETKQDPQSDLFLVQSDHTNGTSAETPTSTPTATATGTATSTVTATPTPTAADEFFTVTIVIPTVRRFQNNGDPAPERYLSPLVQKLWQDLTPAQQKHVNFLILNSDKEPSKHLEAMSLVVHPGVQVLSKPNWDEQLEQTLRANGAIHEDGSVFLEDGRQVSKEWVKWVAAEDMDGAYLLELGMKQSDYVLFLEDDVWPTTAALAKLNTFVKNMVNKPWLFLDLYTPNLDWAPGMLDVRDGEVYPFQCCTQAMLFKSELLPGIVSYWRNHPAEPVDDNLRNYRSKMTPNLQIYAARPNLFEHVGAYSSNPQKSTGIVEHTSLEFVPLLFQEEAKTTA